MTASRIEDLTDVSVEHMLGATTGRPLVKLRAESAGTGFAALFAPPAAEGGANVRAVISVNWERGIVVPLPPLDVRIAREYQSAVHDIDDWDVA